MSGGESEWRWADPQGQQRLIRTDELRAALANGVIPPNAPVWKRGWTEWQAAFDVPELTSSALSAANGVVPNIPPPPLFVVAAQTAFEGSPASPSMDGIGDPPPPPRYVPAPVKPPDPPSSSSSLSRPPPSVKPGAGGASGPSSVSRAPASMRTPISQRMSATEALKRAVPSSPKLVSEKPKPLPPDTQRDISGAAKPVAPSPGVSPKATTPRNLTIPTMVGVPRIGDPRTTSSNPPRSANPTPPMPMVTDRARPDPTRATLLFDGSAPSEPTLANDSPAPPIVAPGSGGAEKNAVTRPPPMDMGTVKMSPGTARDKQDSVEEISDSIVIEHSEQVGVAPKVSRPPKLPARASKPPPPGLKALASVGPRAVSRPPAPPIDGYEPPAEKANASKATVMGMGALTPPMPMGITKPATPPPAGVASSVSPSTLMGGMDVGPIPSPGPPPADLMAQVGEGSQSSFPDERARIPGLGGPTPPWLEKILDRFPRLRPLQQGRPIFFLPVVGGLAALVALICFGVVVRGCLSLVSSDPKQARRTATDDSDQVATNKVSDNKATTAPPTASSVVGASPDSAPVTSPGVSCRPSGIVKTLSPKAIVPAGVEAVSFGKTLAVGFATGPKEGLAIEVEPATLNVLGTAKARGTDLKRVTPIQSGGRLFAAGDADKAGEALSGGRTIAAPNPFEIGLRDNALAWAPRGGGPTNLWTIEGEGPVEAVRAVQDGAGWAIAFRRNGGIHVGSLNAQMKPTGSLSETRGLGPQVGSPSIAASAGALLVMWADRASAEQPWGLRMRHTPAFKPTEEPRAFTPIGGPGAPFIAPSVVGLGTGRFFVVWTEGTAQNHEVRGATLDANGRIEGAPFAISPSGVNAGQAQAALGPDGRGVVAYLVSSSSGKGFELAAAGVTCTAP